MKIAITSLYLPSGSKIGVGYQVHGLANALTGRGHQVTVFSPCSKPEDARYTVHQVLPGKRFRTFGFAWDLREVDFTRFDVLNAHGDDWFLWGVKRPHHIHTYHGSCLAEMFNISGLKAKARMGLLAACETQALLLADVTVAVSDNTRRYIPGIRHVIPCGVDTGAFTPGDRKSDRPSILFVGTMHGRKRGRMLVELFQKKVLTVYPDAELWCVCERPEDLTETSGLRFFGRIPETELVELYQRAWAFCLPSTYEGFGVPYIEAMASGTPVVAARNPGAVEVTMNGQVGVVAEDKGLAAKLNELLGDAESRKRFQELGLKRAKDFSWESVCTQYEKLYSAS